MVQLFGSNPERGTPANAFLFGTFDANGVRITADGAWDDVSARFVAATAGQVRVIGPNASASGVFGATELPALLNNPNVTTIDGIPREQLAVLRDTPGEGLASVQRFVFDHSLFQIHLSGLTTGGASSYLALAPDQYGELLKDPVKFKAIDDAIGAMEQGRYTAFQRGMGSALEGAHVVSASGVGKALNKLGLVGGLLGFLVAGHAAAAEHSAGNTEGAKAIMAEWAVDASGSELGSIIGTAVGTVAVGIAAAAGVVVSAPLAGAVVFGAALLGGFVGSDAATELYHLLDDRDANGRHDVFDKLSNLLFGATSTITTPLPPDLNGEQYTLDASFTRDEMVAQARDSIAWRYALRELNGFVITDVDYARHNTDGSLDLYDEATGQGAMTERYMADRAAMLTWKLLYETDGAADDDDDEARSGPKPYNEEWDTSQIEGNWDFVDLSTRLPGGAPLTFSVDGTGLSLHDHQVVFGSANGETIEGGGETDSLYGMGGNDTLSGQGGDDHLEGGAGTDTLAGGAGADTLWGGAGDDVLDGGAGNDTLRGGTGLDSYRFSAGSGHDLIEDSDGAGRIDVEGFGVIDGRHAVKVGEGMWQAPDRSVSYSLLPQDGPGGGHDLYIRFRDRSDVIVVRGWSAERSLGITLPAEVPALPALPALPPLPAVFDWSSSSDSDWRAFQRAWESAGQPAMQLMNVSAGLRRAQGSDFDDLIVGGGALHAGGRSFAAVEIAGRQGDDRLFAVAEQTLAQALAGVPVLNLPPGTTEGPQLDGGAGDDFIVGSTADDLAFGGEGDDRIVTGDGRDIVFSDGDMGSSYRTAAEAGQADATLGGTNSNGLQGGTPGPITTRHMRAVETAPYYLKVTLTDGVLPFPGLSEWYAVLPYTDVPRWMPST